MSTPKHTNLGSLKVDYPSPEWVERADEYVKRVSGRMQEAIDAAAKYGRDDYRVQQASAGAWLSATDLRRMAIERGIYLIAAERAAPTPAPEGERKPLTHDEVTAGWEGARDGTSWPSFLDGIRFAERHHGIHQAADGAQGGESDPYLQTR